MNVCVLDEELYRLHVIGPQYVTDAGVDLLVREGGILTGNGPRPVPLGVAVEIPEGMVGWVVTRSSTLARHGLIVVPSVVDHGYQGEIHALVTPAVAGRVTLRRFERICQLVVQPITTPLWTRVDGFAEAEGRGSEGLGSTG